MPEWRARMRDVHFSVTGVAREAGMAADNAQRIMDGRNKNPGVLTVKALEDAIERLRDTCPVCHRRGLKEALRNGLDRRTKTRGAKPEAAR